jgi:hypothetical protein
MKRSHFFFVIAAAVLGGCSSADQTTSPVIGPSVTPPSRPAAQTLRGTVVSTPTQEILPQLSLRIDDGTLIGLIGPEAAALVSVVGADVEVVGTTPTDLLINQGLVEVERFVVLSVGGSNVSDGVLELIDGAYSLDLTTGGRRELADPPTDLADHVGERIWLTMADDGSPLTYGVITSAMAATGAGKGIAKRSLRR